MTEGRNHEYTERSISQLCLSGYIQNGNRNSALESEIEKYDERISAVDEKLPQLEEVSDLTGIVQEVQRDLSNPVITIASAENKVQGMLTEKEQAVIEPGMEVSISLKNKTKTYKGTIQQVSKSPKEEPEVEKESQYPFTAVLDEPIEEWAHGTHVDVKIVTEEIANAITVPEQAINKTDKTKQVFVLNQGLVGKTKRYSRPSSGQHYNRLKKESLKENMSLGPLYN